MHRQTRFYFTICLTIFILLAIPLSSGAAETQKSVEYETGFYYTVQEGDTLWDLSRKFSNTPWLWPEMWRENEQIANPHRIYPGERIRLYRRQSAQGYGGTATDAGDADLGKAGPASSKKDKRIRDKPELTRLLHYDFAAIDRVGFIRKEAVLPHGTIFKVEGQKVMISTSDLVYIRPQEEFTLLPGEKYTLYRTLKPIRKRRNSEFIGIQHYFTGAVEIIIKRPEFVLARVVATYRPIKVGDMLMPYMRRMPRVAMEPSPAGLEGSIIEAEEHQRIFGESSIAFIDKGTDDGVHPGQIYWIYKQEKYRIDPKHPTAATLTPVILGELLVLHSEKTTATVVITDSRKPIQAGAKIITPFNLE